MGRVEPAFFCNSSHLFLELNLLQIIFRHRDELYRVLRAFAYRGSVNLLLWSGKQLPCFRLPDHFFPRFLDFQPFQEARVFIHLAISIYGNPWLDSLLAKKSYVSLVAESAHHHQAGALFHVRIRMGPDRNLLSEDWRNRRLPLEVPVSPILRVENNHAARAHELGACGADYYLLARLLHGEYYVIECRRHLDVVDFRVGYCCAAAGAVVIRAAILINQPFLPKVDERRLGKRAVFRRIGTIHVAKLVPNFPRIEADAKPEKRVDRRRAGLLQQLLASLGEF